MGKQKGGGGGGSAGAGGKSQKQHEHDTKDYSSFKTVLFYCSLIVFLPVATFFLLKAVILDSLFTLTEVKSNIFSAVGAVVSLHIALGFYIYRAYFGGAPPAAQKKAD